MQKAVRYKSERHFESFVHWVVIIFNKELQMDDQQILMSINNAIINNSIAIIRMSMAIFALVIIAMSILFVLWKKL